MLINKLQLDLEEQEQLAELKAWWKQYGKWLICSLIVVLSAYVGWKTKTYYQHRQSSIAEGYFNLLNEVKSDTSADLIKPTRELQQNYANTPYAGRASLMLASYYYKKGDVATCQTVLNWALQNATEETVQAIARLQLVRIHIEKNQLQTALQLVSLKKPIRGFEGLLNAAKGDVLIKLGRNKEAKVAYQQALTTIDNQSDYFILVQEKLNTLG